MKTIKELKEAYDRHLDAFNLKRKDGLLTTALNAAQKESEYLTQEFIDAWCMKRATEKDNSYNARIGHLMRFLRFCNERGCDYRLPKLLPAVPTEIPYIPTEEELVNLFRAADEFADIAIKHRAKLTQLRNQLTAIQAPVVFRAMLSTGMRPIDARFLTCDNVDLEKGWMKLYGKGYKERKIPIHPSLLNLLRQYELLVKELIPERKYFFCQETGNVRSKHWPCELFKQMWNRYNDPKKRAVAYCLRHLFAIRNIDSWDGQCIDDHLAVLSHVMGHDDVETTIKDYYHWLPERGAQFNDKNRAYFDLIAPKKHN